MDWNIVLWEEAEQKQEHLLDFLEEFLPPGGTGLDSDLLSQSSKYRKSFSILTFVFLVLH